MKTKRKPMCAYCGGPRYHAPGTPRPVNKCECKYRFMRMGESGFEIETTTGKQLSAMREEIMKYLGHMESDALVAFKFSVTRLDEEKIAKALVKRQAKKVADRLLGKGK